MMKLTLAFLATLAATEAAHGRRHVRRDDYGYKPYPVPNKSSSSAPFPLSTGVPSSAPAPASSSSSPAPGTGVPSFSLDLTSTGAPGIPSSAPGVSFPGSPSGSVSLSVGSFVPPSSVADAASTVIVKSSTRPSFPSGTGSNPPVGTGVKPPVGTGVSVPYGEYVTTTTIYSTQIKTIVVTKGGEVATSLSTTVVAIPSKCTKTSGVADSTATVKSEPITKVVHVSTETLTYTVGVGSTAHAVTTEIVQTSTETIYKTIVVTLPYPGNGNHGATATVSADKPEGTTVISQTSTTTKFITVFPTPSAGSEGSVVPPVPTGGDAPVCVPPKTVTVTEKETVTVTAGKEEVPATQVPVSTPIFSEVKPTTLPTTAPYPFGNSTTVVIPGSTGFATFTKTSSGLVGTGTAPAGSTATVGTDIPTPTNTVSASSTKGTEASTGLPSFAFPSKEAVSTTGAPAKGASSAAVPVKPTTSAKPIGYTPPKGNYGYRRRA